MTASAPDQQAGSWASPAPAVARQVFGPALPLAQRYAELLAGPGIVRGLVGPREADRLWDRHLLNCAQAAELIPRPSALVDIGSGAGLPGLVLAMLLPDVRVTLIEPTARRVAFLEECVSDLELANVTIRRARAEDVAGEYAADVVTARAVAPLDRLAGLAVPLVRPGGVVLALKGERAGQEADAAAPVLRRLGVSEVTVLRVGGGRDCPATTVVRMITRGRSRAKRR
jgi:16S rRNA (guanine527-N7)-methyltransferase